MWDALLKLGGIIALWPISLGFLLFCSYVSEKYGNTDPFEGASHDLITWVFFIGAPLTALCLLTFIGCALIFYPLRGLWILLTFWTAKSRHERKIREIVRKKQLFEERCGMSLAEIQKYSPSLHIFSEDSGTFEGSPESKGAPLTEEDLRILKEFEDILN